ncbi:MAG: hypothetical protein ACLU2K_00720 [Clostridia bacterium]|nr:hypothetical protein [Oscillospiraceae bacterium]
MVMQSARSYSSQDYFIEKPQLLSGTIKLTDKPFPMKLQYD